MKSTSPTTLEGFIGQETAKLIIKPIVRAAIAQSRPAGHLLFWGPPGLGKTTMARIIAAETASLLIELTGPALTRKSLIGHLISICRRDVILIDEIHRLPPDAAEILYSAMDRFVLQLGIAVDIPPFTLIGTTTELASVPEPLRSRFKAEICFSFYSPAELTQIILRAAVALGVQITPDGAEEIALRARGVPRTAHQLISLVSDFCSSDHITPPLNRARIAEILDPIVDRSGITRPEIEYLTLLALKFGGGPAGIGTLASAMGHSPRSLASAIEPGLLRFGLIEITPRGRQLTPAGTRYLAERQRGNGEKNSQIPQPN